MMFELLLQGDKALAGGRLDQAERTYSQVIELDPTNAIALAGLARVSMQRGDQGAARDYADRALSADPDSVAARQVIEDLAAGGSGLARVDSPELPLGAAERLEALSRRRAANSQSRDETGAAEPAGTKKSAAKAAAPAAEKPGPAPARQSAAQRPAPAARQAAGPDRGSRGRTRSNQMAPLPAEPLRERQAGRLAAAAAAAAAAAGAPARSRREPHHAMPVGRRYLAPGRLKAPSADEFMQAEMAAAVEAVDALEEGASVAAPVVSRPAPVVSRPAPVVSRAASAEGRRGSQLADALGAVNATEADESVAMRIALLGGAGLETAEAVPPADGSSESANADAAEAEAAAEAIQDFTGATAEMEEEAAPAPRHFEPAPEEPTEEEAEEQAMREAMVIVLQGEREAQTQAAATSAAEEAAAGAATPDAKPQAAEPGDAVAPVDAEAGPEPPPRRRGRFGLFRGD